MSKDEQDDIGAKAQGRPAGGAKEQGREQLIEKARDAMRAPPKIDVQRREIAEHAGVTPALVSYYFPDRTDLLELAAQPVIASYVADVEAVLRSVDEPERKLERIVAVFLAFNSDQGAMIDHFVQISLAKSKADNIAGLRAIEDLLTAFFDELIAAGVIRNIDPSLIQAALWGICRHVGRRRATDVFQIDCHLAHDPGVLACQIRDLLLRDLL